MKADDHLPMPPRLDSAENGLSSDGHQIVERKTSWASMSTSSSTPKTVPISNNVAHNSLFVQGLPQGLGSADLVTIFSQFGEILSSTRVIHGRGYGFVDFATDKGFETALNSAEKNLLQVDGLYLRIERVKTPGGVRESVNVIPATNKRELTFHPPKTSTRHPLKPVRGQVHRSNPQLILQQQQAASFQRISLGSLQRISSTAREERKHRHSLVKLKNPHKTHPAKMISLNHNRIVIRQIPDDTTIDDLKKVFAAYGSVRSIHFRKKTLSSETEDSSSENDDFDEEYAAEESPSEAITKAKTMHYLNIRYSDGTNMTELIETIEKEGLEVKQTDTTAIRVGPYDVRPNLMEGIEFLDPFGDLLGVEIQTTFVEAVVVYEYEASMEKVMKAPVFCRGAKLILVVKSK